jgi:tripartite ATP-independent transporter DctM subunit
MDPTIISLLCILGLFIFMMLGVPIVYSLGFIAVFSGLIFLGSGTLYKVGLSPFSALFNLGWTPLPLFVLLGAIIAESGMGKDLFRAAANWLSRIRGGLIVAGILGEALLAATLGTSAAAIIVVGKVAVPEFEKQGYNKGFSLGALLAGGVLGPLIPPSATMIIYAVLTNVSLGRLFIAGIIPGIILVFFLSIPAIIICYLKPGLAPQTYRVSWRERFSSLKGVWPITLVMFSILGSIYFGIATPTETAGVGSFIVLLIAIFFFRLRWEGLRKALVETATVNGLILFIIVAATFFTYVVGSTNVAKHLHTFVESESIAPWQVIVVINIIYLILGCLIDPITITLLTIPIFVPLIISLGMDPIWFGVMFVVNTQIGLITPPMGVDLFAIKTIFNIPTRDIIRGVFPFLISEILFLALISAFPPISLWLPNMMVGR